MSGGIGGHWPRIEEAPESIDRSGSHSDIVADSDTVRTGETVHIKGADMVSGDVMVTKPSGETVNTGPSSYSWRFTPSMAGDYHFETSTGEYIDDIPVEPGAGNAGEETIGNADDYTNVDNSTDVDPADYGMVVNADNESGIALAPSAVRDGITADEDGTEVSLSDGTTVTVYPREDTDEAIRSPETGDPVDSPVGSGGVEGGVGSDSSSGGSGLLGGAVAVVVLVLAAGAALLGGGGGGD